MNANLDKTMTATKGLLREMKREDLQNVQGGSHTFFHDDLFVDYLRNFLDYRGLKVLLRTPGPIPPPRL